MSYYIYCYQSQLGTPDIKEAQSVIEVIEECESRQSDYKRKLEIAEALINCNPDFTKSYYNFDSTSTVNVAVSSESTLPSVSIQLNTILASDKVEVTIFDDNISLTVPYWYKDLDAQAIFEKLVVYTKIISRISGYYVYDPQAETVYDPLKTCFGGLSLYLKLAKTEHKITT